MSAEAVAVSGSGDETRQDVEQGSILSAKAWKLLSLHGPSNWTQILTNFGCQLGLHSTQPPWINGLVYGLDTKLIKYKH